MYIYIFIDTCYFVSCFSVIQRMPLGESCNDCYSYSSYYFRHVNLREVLSKYNPRTAAPLDELSKLCRFPGKLGMDVSQVERAWELGRANAVRAYCETDVTNTWLLYCRFQLLF